PGHNGVARKQRRRRPTCARSLEGLRCRRHPRGRGDSLVSCAGMIRTSSRRWLAQCVNVSALDRSLCRN
uniref:Uncharacterized protein n=1 Tax=Aegilops tauschii subsp. strangulata TaxID=200361 RepID=A0A452ZFW8_AEGTS